MTEPECNYNGILRRPALACGRTAPEAASAFARVQWPGESYEFRSVEEDDGPDFRVRVRIGGTSVKIDGHKVPGGYVVTEWV